ncbi:MAG: carbohydrate kinase family protein [Candidatus Heimdallarchaeota archaeon]
MQAKAEMSTSSLLDELLKFGRRLKSLQQKLHTKQCISLPDIYLDRIVVFNDEFSKLLEQIDQFLAGKARNILVQKQELILGGNAFNTAKTTAWLGLPTIFIAETDRFGETLLCSTNYDNLILHLKVTDKGNYTTALEVLHNGVCKNIQISYSPAIANFGSDKLEKQDWQAILKADAIALCNWGANDKANDLFRAILDRISETRQITFLDPADVFRKKEAILELVDILQDIKYLSVNEDEYMFMNKKLGESRDFETLLREGGQLNQKLPETHIIVHTQEWVKIFCQDLTLKIPTYNIQPLFQTGLGDTFNAGFLVGLLLEMSVGASALFGSATAGYYGVYGQLPHLEEVFTFTQTKELRPMSVI